MEWSDKALVLGVRHHGETSAILELMTRHHGRFLGLVRGGRSRKMRPILQLGNLLNVTWRARLDEHLGQYQVEPHRLRAANLMADRYSLFCVQLLASHLRLLPEREALPQMYEAANIILDHVEEKFVCAHLIVRFELALLDEMGFGLNLTQCVVSGAKQNLVWVSPKSGCAVSAAEGAPWANKLLILPNFLTGNSIALNEQEIALEERDDIGQKELLAGFKLTGHFLTRHVYGPRAIAPPLEREKVLKELLSIPSN